MNYSLVYFSPTYTTQKILKLIAEDITTDIVEFNITNSAFNEKNFTFGENEFVILGIPVYSGRVPQAARERISSMRGNNTPIALIATYGNRHYDDSLLELKTIVESNKFMVIAAVAFVTEHSVVPKFGSGRPNNNDIKIIHNFAELLKKKIATWDNKGHIDLKVNGNPNYRKYHSIPIKPHVNSLCNKCGACAKGCPVGAIPLDNPKKTERSKCITCVRCIRICPQKARCFYLIEKTIAEKSLENLCREYKQPEIFI